MEALQRIRIFRLFDVFSLLDCLYGLRADGLQQVGDVISCFFYSDPAEAFEETDQISSYLILSRFFFYQASVGGGSVKAVIVDSVSAVIAPLLGGKQNEGDISFCSSIIPEAGTKCVSANKCHNTASTL